MFFDILACLYGCLSRYAILRPLRGMRRFAPRGDSTSFQRQSVVSLFVDVTDLRLLVNWVSCPIGVNQWLSTSLPSVTRNFPQCISSWSRFIVCQQICFLEISPWLVATFTKFVRILILYFIVLGFTTLNNTFPPFPRPLLKKSQFHFLVKNDAQCSETNEKSIFQFFRFLVFEIWSIFNHLYTP